MTMNGKYLEQSPTLKSFLDDLERFIEELAKYCHDEVCDSIYACPQRHVLCSDKLDLDTAIAWKTARILHSVRGIFLNSYPKFNKTELTKLASIFYAVDHTKNIVALHMNKYSELLEIFERMDTMMVKFKNILFTFGVII